MNKYNFKHTTIRKVGVSKILEGNTYFYSAMMTFILHLIEL